MENFFACGSKEADAIAELLGHSDLATLRMALRRAAHHDMIGDREAFAVLYRRLGGRAEITERPLSPRDLTTLLQERH